MACSLSDKSLLSITQQCQLCQDSMWYGYYIPVYRLSTGIYGMFIVPNHIREFYKQNLFILSGFRSKMCLKKALEIEISLYLNRDLSILLIGNWNGICRMLSSLSTVNLLQLIARCWLQCDRYFPSFSYFGDFFHKLLGDFKHRPFYTR